MSFHKEHILKLSNSEEEYKLIIIVENNDNKIQFNIKNIKNPNTDNYYLKMTKDELTSLDNYFRIFDNIIDCALNISNILKDSTPKLTKEHDKMILGFTIFMPGQDKRDIKLDLDKKSFDIYNVIDQLNKEINKLKTKVNDLEISINKKDTMYDALKCNYDDLKKDYDLKMEQFKVELTNIKSLLPKNNNSDNNSNSNPLLKTFDEQCRDNKDELSTIINNNLELNILSNKIRLLYPGKNVIYNLLYRKTRDSDNASIFHSKCDKIKGTLLIIHTNKGYKIGGYTNESWEGDNISKKDNTAFIFNLNYNKIYNIKKDADAIYCSPNFGPIFSGLNAPSLLINDNYNIKGGESTTATNSNYNGFTMDYEISGGERIFKIKELEIWKVTLV